MTLSLTSPAFVNASTLPIEYTCDGAGHSPPLEWHGAPTGTRSFVLICDDPDAPSRTFVHWVLYNVPADVTALPAALPTSDTLPQLGNAHQGMTDYRRTGYGSPCPPPGPAHRYQFTLRAIDALLQLGPGARWTDVEHAIEGHVLDTAQLIAPYARRNR